MLKVVQWNNHPILGNLKLDFRNGSGTYKVVVLAGENGTGKTTILESLARFLNRYSFEFFDNILYQIDSDEFELSPLDQATRQNNFTRTGFHKRKNLITGESKDIYSAKNNDERQIESDLSDIRHYGCFYSKAKSGFRTNPVTSSTTSQLDVSKYEIDENEDYTSIKQLFVDLTSQDNAELRKMIDGASSEKGDSVESLRERIENKGRISRFKKAFNKFFDKLQYDEVDENDSNEKKVLFKKNGSMVPIDSLSTGEKQIVFRGTYLLRNSKNLKGGIVLIDEPELSLHPKWQERILQFYQDLFTESGTQFAQLIVATHSEYVIKAALANKNFNLVYSLKDNNGAINATRVDAPSRLPSITFAETNYLTFGIPTNDYHIELYSYLQTKTGNFRIKDCDDYIVNHSLYNSSMYGKASSHGTTNYRSLPTYIRNAIDHPDNGNVFTEEELLSSIEFLRELCK